MRKLFFPFLWVFPVILHSQITKIKIDMERKISEIDPDIYGVFMESVHFSAGDWGYLHTYHCTGYVQPKKSNNFNKKKDL